MAKKKKKEEVKVEKRVVACYARVSTSSKEQASSFENQKSFFEDYIEKSDKYELYNIYADPGVSGTLFKRKQFEKMLYDAGIDLTIDPEEIVKPKDLNVLSDEAEGKPSTIHYINYTVKISSTRQPKFNEILVRNTSRFARNVEVDLILKRLHKNHVYVRFLDIDKTTENESDISIIQLFQTFDELFVRDLSRKVLAGNERSVANKILRSTTRLYGYKYIPRANLQENNSLEPIPHEAEVVQKIYRLYLGCYNPKTAEGFIGCDFVCSSCTITKTKGYGVRRIINYLTDNGIKTRNKKNFGPTSLKNLLSNEKYAGYINTGKYTSGTIFNKLPSPKVREEYLLELDPINIPEPIISPELFYLCEAMRESRLTTDSKGRAQASSHYGGGFLRCAKCGSNYQHNIDRGVPFYLCGLKKSKGTKACNAANVKEETITNYLYELIEGDIYLHLYSQGQEHLLDVLNAVHRHLSYIQRNRDEDKVQALTEDVARYNKRIDNIYARLLYEEEGKEDTTALDRLIKENKALLSETEIELERYTKKPKQFLKIASDLMPRAERLIEQLHQLNQEVSQEYTEADIDYIDHIVVHGTTQQLGGKPSPVTMVPVIYKDPELVEILSASNPDLKTYKPLKIKIAKGQTLYQDQGDTVLETTINKKEADALSTDPTHFEHYTLETLVREYILLSKTLQALQELY